MPHELFDPETLARDYLDGFDPDSQDTRYYKAILQNFFFAALNQTKGERGFRRSGSDHRDNMSMMRYKSLLKEPKERLVETVESVTPFLNGGLFECLDFLHPNETGPRGGKKKVYEDGFSDRDDNPLRVPDFLFFGGESTQDLSDDYGDKKRKNERVQGLIHILNRYNFTIVENTPIEQEVALDPELLGKVFENLLASYNPETKTTARKQTGSFYTPRSIVDYMVDESLKAHLLKSLTVEANMTEGDAQAGLDLLFSYEEKDRDSLFEPEQVDVLIRAIDQCKILDPACGSGAFPMGTLQKLVHILCKLDPDNEKWEQQQIDEAQKIEDKNERRERIREIMDDFEDNDDDYGRKLYLIENCLYGVDIQSIATQVSKLRFFISLVVDQKIHREKENFGVRPLPNLETKFITADTLIAAEQPGSQAELSTPEVEKLKKELKDVRHKIFSVKTTKAKQGHKENDANLRERIAEELKANGWPDDTADRLAKWDPYKQNESADFFDPEWMFGLKGFDVVIGNPPYGVKFDKKHALQLKKAYQTYSWRGESYVLFIEKASELLKQHGVISYIVPDTYLNLEFTEPLRKYLRSYFHISEIYGLPAGLFESAVVDTTLLFLDRADIAEATTIKYINKQRSLVSPETPDKQFKIDASEWDDLGVFNIHSDTSELEILKEVNFSHPRLGDFVQVLSGIKAYQVGKGKPPQTPKIRDEKPFTSNRKESDKWKPFLEGKHIERYTPSSKPFGFIYHGPWLAEPRTPELFDGPKIFVRKIVSNTLISYFTKEECYCNTLLFVVKSKNRGLLKEESAQAFLNSTLFGWYFKKYFQITETDTFPQIMAGNICDFPMPLLERNQEILFSRLTHIAQLAYREETAIREVINSTIDACVIECYFHDHMAERDLLFHETVAEVLKDYNPDAPEAEQLTYLETLEARLKAAEIPERLARIPTDSPDLLGVILKEGKV